MELVVADGQGSFAAFYDTRYAELVRLATALVGSTEVAEDVVQDAFAAMHGRWARINDPMAYARRAVVNGCRSHHRWRLRRRSPTFGPEPVVEPVGVDRRVDELAAALDRLPHRQRAALVLRYVHDLSDADIARTLDCQRGTVASLIHRGLVRLREEIPR